MWTTLFELRVFPPHARASLLLIALLTLTGCGNLSEQNFSPLVIDDANFLSPETKNWITSFPFPRGYALCVRTVDRLPESLLGAKADDLFDQTAEESNEKKALKKRGVFVLISQEPPLVQIRVGDELYGAARWGGVIAGPEYIDRQALASGGTADSSLRSVVPWLAESLPRAMDLPRYKRVVLQQTQEIIGDEIEELGLPSESFYGHFILKPILQLRVIEFGAFRSWWITYVLVALIIYLVRRLLDLTLGSWHRALSRNSGMRRHVISVIQIILSIGIGIVLSVPSAASTMLLSGSRLEDQIALRASGIPGVERVSFDPNAYRINTGLAIAILILSLRLVKGFGSRANILGPARLPAEAQRQLFGEIEDAMPLYAILLEAAGTRGGKDLAPSQEEFQAAPFKYAYLMPGIDDLKAAVAWSSLALLFLPRPVSLAAVFLWLVPAITGAFDTIKALAGRKDFGSTAGKTSKLFPLAATLLVVLILSLSLTRFGISIGGRSSEPTTAPPLTAQSRLSLHGVGPIRIGMTVEQAREVLGDLRGEEGRGNDPGGCYNVSPAKGPTGISFMIMQGRVARIDIDSSAFSTLSGARVGDREKRVIQLYRGRLDVSPHQYEEKGHYLTFIPRDPAEKNYRLIFETDGKLVTRYRVGKVPEVGFVEGCL